MRSVDEVKCWQREDSIEVVVSDVQIRFKDEKCLTY